MSGLTRGIARRWQLLRTILCQRRQPCTAAFCGLATSFKENSYSSLVGVKTLSFLKGENIVATRAPRFCSVSSLSDIEFDQISEETLESLAEYFEELSEEFDLGGDYDVNYSQGVLTVKFGGSRGTYVINKQSPNKQIWLSSPTSGPKRYDFVQGTWVYSRDQRTLHQLLTNELRDMLGADVDLYQCSYSL